jgi:hypothetical protein
LPTKPFVAVVVVVFVVVGVDFMIVVDGVVVKKNFL